MSLPPDLDEFIHFLLSEKSSLNRLLKNKTISERQKGYWMYLAGKRDFISDLLKILNNSNESSKQELEPQIGFSMTASKLDDEEFEDDY